MRQSGGGLEQREMLVTLHQGAEVFDRRRNEELDLHGPYFRTNRRFAKYPTDKTNLFKTQTCS